MFYLWLILRHVGPDCLVSCLCFFFFFPFSLAWIPLTRPWTHLSPAGPGLPKAIFLPSNANFAERNSPIGLSSTYMFANVTCWKLKSVAWKSTYFLPSGAQSFMLLPHSRTARKDVLLGTRIWTKASPLQLDLRLAKELQNRYQSLLSSNVKCAPMLLTTTVP